MAESRAPKAPREEERATLPMMLLILQQVLASTQDARVVMLVLAVLLVIAVRLNYKRYQ